MNAHTPGPWGRWPSEPFKIYPESHLDRPRGGAVDPVADSRYAKQIAVVHEASSYADEYPHRIGRLEAEANARLIAAAPDLLAALKAIEAHWSAGNFSREQPLWDAMSAAIAKARGTS